MDGPLFCLSARIGGRGSAGMGEYRIGVWHMNGRVLGVGVCLLRFVVLVYFLENPRGRPPIAIYRSE
jgi:hypothetical protein